MQWEISQYITTLGSLHCSVVKRIFCYLKSTMDHGLIYSRSSNLSVVGYSDADYAENIDTRRSTTGYTFLFCGGAISWNSKKQLTIVLWTTEAQYMVAIYAAKEVIWLQRLFRDIGFFQDSPIIILFVRRLKRARLIWFLQNSRHSRKYFDLRSST